MTHATSAKTPKGANSITMAVTLSISSEPASNTSASGLPRSAVRIRPVPTRMAKKITASTLPSAKAAKGFSGTIPINRSVSEPALSSVVASAPLRSMPTPGRRISASTMPITMAQKVVPRYSAIAFPPIEPRRFGSFIAVTPDTSVTNTSGTISILIMRMNRSPIHLICWLASPMKNPAIAPSTNAARMRFHSTMPNHRRASLRIMGRFLQGDGGAQRGQAERRSPAPGRLRRRR